MKYLRARIHELRCRECRVSWRSWWDRVLHERPASRVAYRYRAEMADEKPDHMDGSEA